MINREKVISYYIRNHVKLYQKSRIDLGVNGRLSLKRKEKSIKCQFISKVYQSINITELIITLHIKKKQPGAYFTNSMKKNNNVRTRSNKLSI